MSAAIVGDTPPLKERQTDMLGSSVGHALREAGLLPADCVCYSKRIAGRPGRDLLPLLIHAWRQTRDAAPGKSLRVVAARRAEWLARQHAAGARLTLGVPRCAGRPIVRWLGHRLYWWPRGIPKGHRVGLTSSRLPRAMDRHRLWFAALRAACGEIDSGRCLILTAASTTAGRFVERCAELFRLRCLRLESEDGAAASYAKWGRRICTATEIRPLAAISSVVLSPPLTHNAQTTDDETLSQVPSRDRAVAALSDRLFVFRIRPHGNWHGLIRARLIDPAWPAASVSIAVGPGLASPRLARQLLDLGAARLEIPDGARQQLRTVSNAAPNIRRRGAAAGTADIPPAEDWQFLTHCTRRQNGPWPNQTEEEYLDDLILDRADADHSALAALRRIVQQQRLIASSCGIRGATPVVSFTDVPLAELHRLNVFRAHRGRWDFEPFGICIRRSWLKQRGARPVRYGDDGLWATLHPDEQPFYQIRQTRCGEDRSMNWTAEREWRCVGDVDLQSLPADSALLFAPSRADAQALAQLSRWPVTVLRRAGRV